MRLHGKDNLWIVYCKNKLTNKSWNVNLVVSLSGENNDAIEVVKVVQEAGIPGKQCRRGIDMSKKNRPYGHYCKISGEYKTNPMWRFLDSKNESWISQNSRYGIRGFQRTIPLCRAQCHKRQ